MVWPKQLEEISESRSRGSSHDQLDPLHLVRCGLLVIQEFPMYNQQNTTKHRYEILIKYDISGPKLPFLQPLQQFLIEVIEHPAVITQSLLILLERKSHV